MAEAQWIELLKARNYPLPDLTKFDWDTQQKINAVENKEYFKNAKNVPFCKKKSTSICITIHEPWKYYESPSEFEEILKDWYDKEIINYYVASLEIGKENKTFHIQGYIKFNYYPRPYYKAILKKLKTVNVNIISARGTMEENATYISKDESNEEYSNIEKWIITSGDADSADKARKNLNCSEFVDYAIKHDININNHTMDLYCANYRSNPKMAKSIITELYNTRISQFKDDTQILPHMTFCGNTGSGKSLITEYLFKKIGAKINQEVVKMEASKGRERLWFNCDASLMRAVWFTEMNSYFPNKTHLLGLLDRQSNLEVKGKDSVPNMFDILILNSTNITTFTIYNLSQSNNQASYSEIARRLFDYGPTYFVEPNIEFKQLPRPVRQKMLKEDFTGTIEKYPPHIYLFAPEIGDYKNGECYPDDLALSLELPAQHKSKLVSKLTFMERKPELPRTEREQELEAQGQKIGTVYENITVKDNTYAEEQELAKTEHRLPKDFIKDYEKSTKIKYRAYSVTIQEVYEYFIESLKSVNSNLLKLKTPEKPTRKTKKNISNGNTTNN